MERRQRRPTLRTRGRIVVKDKLQLASKLVTQEGKGWNGQQSDYWGSTDIRLVWKRGKSPLRVEEGGTGQLGKEREERERERRVLCRFSWTRMVVKVRRVLSRCR